MASSSEVDTRYSLLTTTPHVTELILSFLSAKQLNRVARVCTVWSKIARKLKKKRKTSAWTCLTSDPNDIDPHYCILNEAKSFFENIYTQPHVVFMFYESDFLHYTPEESYRWNDKQQISDSDFRNLLPSQCKFIGIGSGGIIGTTSVTGQVLELENEPGFTFLCLPNYEGVEFAIGQDIFCVSDAEERFKENYPELLQLPAPSMPCQTILTFVSDYQESRQLQMDLMKHFPNTLVAGAIIDDIISVSGLINEDIPAMKFVSICGDRIKVASVVVHENMQTMNEVEKRVKVLKSYHLPEQRSFAFMFACLGRGKGMFGAPNVESTIFRRYFPNTPLFGVFGNGEIGFDFVSVGSGIVAETKPKRKSPQTKLYHGYTTIYVLVSIM